MQADEIKVIPQGNEYQGMVRCFNQGIGAKPDVGLRVKLIQEEAQEFMDAVEAKDAVEAIDALCDLLYVIYGAADVLDLGWLDTSDAEKAPATGELSWPVLYKEMPDFIPAVGSAVTYLRHLNNPLLEGESYDSRKMAKLALEDLAEGCWQAAADGVGVDLRPFFREVHRTNMRKLSGPMREDGKQLKPPGWKPPRIKEMYERVLAGQPADIEDGGRGDQ